MASSNSFTSQQAVLQIVSDIVDTSFPHERDILPVLWTRWLATQNTTSEINDFAPGGLPAVGTYDDSVRTPFVIMTIAAVLDEIPDRDVRPSLDQIRSAVHDAAVRLGIGGPVLRDIVTEVPTKLHAMFHLLTSDAGVESPARPADHSWIEWNPQDAATSDRPGVHCQYCDSNAVKQMRDTRNEYTLFIDETDEFILIRPETLSKEEPSLRVAWDELTPKSARFLGLVLRHCREKTFMMTFKEIRENVVGINSQDTQIRDVKSKLNKALHGLLNKICKAEKGRQRYRIVRVPSYCWLRPEKTYSRLCD